MYLLFKCRKCEHNLYIPIKEAIDKMSSLSDYDCPNCGEEGYENWIFVSRKRMKYDKATKEWFELHPTTETTIMICDKCGLGYKPSLGHKCRKEENK